MQEAEDKFGKKGRTNAALTLGIIGTALGAFTGNNGCGCGNNGIRDTDSSSIIIPQYELIWTTFRY